LPENSVSLKQTSSVITLSALGILALAASGHAQVASPKLTITNTSPASEIPLKGFVEIDASGDVRIECVLDAAGKCPSVGGGGSSGGTNPPTVSLTPSSTSLLALGSFSLSWTSSTGTNACYGVGPAGVTNWTDAMLPANGTRSLSLPVGSYSFEIRCFNATGVTSQTTVPVTVAQNPDPDPGTGTGTGDYCSEYYPTKPTAASFTAYGFARTNVDFLQIWGVNPGQPTSNFAAVPALYLAPSTFERYMSIPFVMTQSTGSTAQFRLSWSEPQAIPDVNPGGVAISISPCPGDFRQRDTAAVNDEYLRGACRTTGASLSGGLTITADHTLAGCRVPVNKVMYINLANYHMFNEAKPSSSTCGVNATCGVAMHLR
jgi:hypothetical protein